MGDPLKPKRLNQGSVYPDPRTGYLIVQWNVSGKRFRIFTHSLDWNAAEKLRIQKIAERDRGILFSPAVNRCKFKELADDVLADYKRKGRKSVMLVEIKFERFILPFFGHLRQMEITKPLIDLYGDERAKKVRNDTVNHELSIIRRCFSLGVKNGKVQNPPFVELRKSAGPRQGTYKWHEAELLMRELEEPLRNLPLFYFICGWRLREALHLEWSWVDLDARTFRIPGRLTKNGKDKTYAFAQDSRMEALLLAQREYTDRVQRECLQIVPLVFHRDGKEIKSFRAAWLNAHKRAQIPLRTVHDFRRTFRTMCEQAGVPEATAMRAMGHESVNVSRNYIVTDVESLRDTNARVERQIDRIVANKKR